MANVLFWFRNDLRLQDNEAFTEAVKLGPVVPVYIIDNRQFELSNLGFKRMGFFRLKFLLESLKSLKEDLKSKGADLVVKVGQPEQILFDLSIKYDVQRVIASKEVTQDETTVESAFYQKLKSKNIDIDFYWSNTLVHVRDLPFQIHFVPDVFTDFRKKVEGSWKIRPLIESPGLIHVPEDLENTKIPSMEDLGYEQMPIDLRDANRFEGGEKNAQNRLKEFIWEKDLLKSYKETRNGMLGKDYSSKLSPFLSLGCISAKQIYYEVKKYESEVISNESTYWLIFELLWKDYFYFIALKFGIRLFKRCGIKHDLTKTWKRNKEHFNKWINGQTGVPFIDAIMVELKTTGYTSNRGRQLVASFFTKDLGIEWWWGATYFESQLIDYEVCSNWGNWNYIAGVGTDPRHDRYFNPVGQAKKYDPEADYIKHWLPQLGTLPSEELIKINNIYEILDDGIEYPAEPILKNKKW